MANLLTLAQLRAKTPAQRTTFLRELKTQLRELRVAQRAGSLRKVHQVARVRRSIAKVLTIQSEKSQHAH